MFFSKVFLTQDFWKYVDELNGRDYNLAYPRALIKALKKVYYEKGDYELGHITEMKLAIPYHYTRKTVQEIELTPNLVKALREYFLNRPINDIGNCPTDDELINIALEQDKFFAMMIDLGREAHIIRAGLKKGEYQYASIAIGSLFRRYGREVITALNQYLDDYPTYVIEKKKRKTFYISFNAAYVISNEAYLGIMIFESYQDMGDEEYPELVYENYDILTYPDEKLRIPPKGSFLEDCKAIAKMKKEVLFDYSSFIEFHDLIRYGYYSDKILSFENMQKVSEIFGHKQWLNTFLLALALYCNRYIKIEDYQDQVDTKALIDTNKIEDFDMFVQAIKYFDSIYDKIVLKPEKK